MYSKSLTSRGWVVACAVWCVVVCGRAALAQQPSDGDGRMSPSLQAIQEELNVQHLDLQQLDVPANGAPFQLSVMVDGETVILDVWPHDIRSQAFQVLVVDDQGIHAIEPPAPRTYRGVVRDSEGIEIPGSVISGLRSPRGFDALINMNDGWVWSIQSLARLDLSSDDADHALFRSDDVLPTDDVCGVDHSVPGMVPEIDEPAEAQRTAQVTPYKVADIAFEADFLFFLANGSSVVNTMADIEFDMNSVESIYEDQTDITYEVTAIVVRTTSGADPYSSNVCGTLLGQFQSHWNSNFFGIPRDMAHLMTGRSLADCAGIAFNGVVCNTSFAYGVSERFTSSYLQVGLMSHEIGHKWNACHCNEGGCVSSPCNIMCNTLNACNGLGSPNFGPGAVSDIVAFRNTRTCLFPSGGGTLADPLTLPVTDQFNSIDPTKWIFNDGGAISSSGVNEPSPSLSLNLDSLGSGEFDQNELRSNFMLMDTAGEVQLSYWTQHRGPESGEQLIVEYWASNLRWINLNTVVSDGTFQDLFVQHQHELSDLVDALAFHDEFRIRFRTEGSDSGDDWYVDNFCIGTGAGCFEQCQAPIECDDGADCTTDDCVGGLCINTPDNALCDDGFGCTTDICTSVGGCISLPDDALCDDDNICTDDTCSAINGCEYTPSSQCAGIELAAVDATDPGAAALGLSLCNVYVQFDTVDHNLLSIAFTNISTDDPNGFHQDPLGADTAPLQVFVEAFPELAYDSFVDIGYRIVPTGVTDGTSTDPDWDSNLFNTGGATSGGWFNSNPANGQGAPDMDARVFIAQFAVTAGHSSSGSVIVFFDDGLIEVPASFECTSVSTCPSDLNGDGTVDAGDLALLLGAWGPNPGSPADFNGDDVVDASDLALLLGDWGPC